MLKDNRFLIGLGIGLIIGAILLELMNVAITGIDQTDVLTDSILDVQDYSLEELKEIADSLDYNIIEKSVVLYTQSELDNAVQMAKQTMVEAPAENPIQDEIIKETTIYRITIQAGMGTKDVTRLLLSADLIDDAQSFEKELSRRELNDKIQVGSFEFPFKPSLTELINEITS